MVRDIEKMIAVGLVWGATNAIMGSARLFGIKLSNLRPRQSHLTTVPLFLRDFYFLSKIGSIPFLINLTASATFFAILSDAPISLAVPVTNATTFAAAAVFGMLLGEETHVFRALFGTAVVILGVWLCIS